MARQARFGLISQIGSLPHVVVLQRRYYPVRVEPEVARAPGEDGDPGVWELYGPRRIADEHSGFDRRISTCVRWGVTGKVLVPKMAYEQDRIVIETDVEHRNGPARCPIERLRTDVTEVR